MLRQADQEDLGAVGVDGEKCVWLGSWNFWRSHHLDRKCSRRRRITSGGNELSVGHPVFAVFLGHVESVEWKYRARIQERSGTRDGIY